MHQVVPMNRSRSNKDEVGSAAEAEEDEQEWMPLQPSHEWADVDEQQDDVSEVESEDSDQIDGDDVGDDVDDDGCTGGVRLGSYNVGQAFSKKLPHVLLTCNRLQLDVLAVQEV